MIRLERGEKPKYLTDKKVQELTFAFKADNKKAVWKHKDIGSSLLESSSYKCAYCECKLQMQDSYMQIEHFKDKDSYSDDVVNWDNLLPSCARCNRKKWTMDVVAEPIINPYLDEPKDHLCHESFRLYEKDDKGKTTITKLWLNDDDRVVYPRFLACNEVGKQLTKIRVNLGNMDEVRNSLAALMQACQPTREYSAFVASSLHANQDYIFLKDELQSSGYWDPDMDELHINSLKLVLDKR